MKTSFRICLVCLIQLLAIVIAKAQVTDLLPETDGEIKSSILDTVGKKLYIAGQFNRIGDIGSYGAPLDTALGLLPATWPDINGKVYAAVPDSNGGWYIGGSFSKVGNTYVQNAAHILANGTIDTNFFETSLPVNSLEKVNNRLYVGGDFDNAGPTGAIYSNAAAFYSSGTINKKFPKINGSVSCVISDQSGGWYVSGSFTAVGDSARNYLAHIDSNGITRHWLPNPNGSVTAMVLMENKLFIAGGFSKIGTLNNSWLAAVDVQTGDMLPWAPGSNSTVKALAVYQGNLVVGGSFTSIGGQARNGIAMLDTATALATAWDPGVTGGSDNLNSLAVADSLIAVGGDFTTAGGLSRNNFAIINAMTGLVTSINPNPTGQIYTVAVAGDTVFLGGNFSTISSQSRNNGAAFNINSGTLYSWNPGANGPVYTLSLTGSSVFAGGNFNNTDYFSAFSRTNWSSLSFDPHCNAAVVSIASFGGQLLIGGSASMGGIGRNFLFSFDLPTATITAWNPSPTNSVQYIKAVKGRIFVSGLFSNIAGTSRLRLALFDTSATPLLSSLSLNPSSPVTCIQFSDSLVYLAGNFISIGSMSRNGIASLSLNSNTITTWNPVVNSPVKSMALMGNKLFIGGAFTTVNSISHNRLAAVDALTGAVFSWDPAANNTVLNLTVSGNKLYASGSFTSIGGQSRTYLAALDTASGLAYPWNPSPDDWPLFLSAYQQQIFVGGKFPHIGGLPRSNAACIDLQNKTITSWDPNSNGPVYTIAKRDQIIYAGGDFSQIGGSSRNNFAALDTLNGQVISSVTLNAGSIVRTLLPVGSTLYVGGDFTSIGSPTRNRAAAINLLNHTVTSWNPDVNSPVHCIAENNDTIYLGGEFSSVGGQLRSRLASVNNSTGAVTSWNPSVTSASTPYVYSLLPNDTSILVGGAFDAIGAQARHNIASVNLGTGLPDSWNPNCSGPVHSMTLYQSSVIVSGGFNFIGNLYNPTQGAIDLASGIATGLTLYTSGQVNNYHFYDQKLYLTGLFTSDFPRIRKNVTVLFVTPSGLNILPVRFTKFGYRCVTAGTELYWQTGQELNNKGFVIELSTDDKNFTPYFFVAGNGSQNSASDYSVLLSQSAANIYARIKQTDRDGKETYTHSLYASCNDPGKTNIYIYPNPAKNELMIDGYDHQLSNYAIYDLQGKCLIKKAMNGHAIDIASLPQGLYILSISSGTGTITRKFMVDR